jgi:hypothetical protein
MVPQIMERIREPTTESRTLFPEPESRRGSPSRKSQSIHRQIRAAKALLFAFLDDPHSVSVMLGFCPTP